MIQPLLERTINKMNEVLEEADLTKRDISRVILVGGSTRMRAVQEAVTQNIKKPYIADNVDEIVAQGAAIMAANLSAPSIDAAPVPIEVKDVTAHSLGIGLYNQNDEYRIFHLIEKIHLFHVWEQILEPLDFQTKQVWNSQYIVLRIIYLKIRIC